MDNVCVGDVILVNSDYIMVTEIIRDEAGKIIYMTATPDFGDGG